MTNLSRDVERFVSVIRDSIEAAIQGPGEVFGPYAFGDDHRLFVEGTWIDTDELARAAHEAVVEHLGPPF